MTRISTPWGFADQVYPLGPDAFSVSTPSHGGIKITSEALARLPVIWRATAYSKGGWFEEDCDWCIPYLALRLDRFEADPARGVKSLESARQTFRTWLNGDPATIEGCAT